MKKNNLEMRKYLLEGQIDSIRLQLLENKKNIKLAKKGVKIATRDEIWCIKARQALLIKKRELKEINKKLFGGNK